MCELVYLSHELYLRVVPSQVEQAFVVIIIGHACGFWKKIFVRRMSKPFFFNAEYTTLEHGVSIVFFKYIFQQPVSQHWYRLEWN